MFDNFLEICNQNYVGVVSVDTETKLVTETIKQITSIKIEKHQGRRCRYTPDDIYAKYISMVSEM